MTLNTTANKRQGCYKVGGFHTYPSIVQMYDTRAVARGHAQVKRGSSVRILCVWVRPGIAEELLRHKKNRHRHQGKAGQCNVGVPGAKRPGEIGPKFRRGGRL